ncbi:MAG: glycosyltransferase family 39 protein [Cyanobacteria bacterium J06614_10]
MNFTDKILWSWLIGGLAFRALIAYFLPAGFDEAYYFLYTQNIDWSYFDHPPAVAWSAGAGIWLTGVVSPLTLRLGALGLYTGSLWLLYAVGRQLFDSKVGIMSCAIATLSPLFFLSFGTLAAPDNALIFFWSLALYLCTLEFFPVHPSPYVPTPRICLIAIALGLACLGKYHGFLLALSICGFCAFTRPYRKALFSKWTGIGVVLFALTVFPIFYWNARHGWISFLFQLGDRFAEYGDQSSSYSLSALLGVWLAQLGYLFPSLGIPLWWVSLQTLFRQILFRQSLFKQSLFTQGLVTHDRYTRAQKASALDNDRLSFLLWSGFPVAICFTLLGGATHTFPAWPAPGLWSLTGLLGYAAARWPQRAVRRWLSSTGWAIAVLLLIALSHISFGTLQQAGRYAPFGGVVAIEQDPSTQLIDTVQLRQKLSQSNEFWDAIAASQVVLTPTYWLSGYIAMSMPAGVSLPISSFTPDPRGLAFWHTSAAWLGKNALFITLENDAQTALNSLSPYFESIVPMSKIATQRGGEASNTVCLYEAKNLIKPYPYPY